MYRPLVTIVIPVYNGSNFLSQSIDSALSQTYKNVEVLVVNDGSNDNGETERVALEYGDRISYFQKTNGGVSSALNLAVTKMKGEWLSWLSHDDLYYPTKIEEQINYIDMLLKKKPGIDLRKVVVRCAAESINIYGKTIHKYYYGDVKENEPIIETILHNVYNYRLAGCSFLLPKDCFRKVGMFNESIRTVSDAEYWYRLLFAGYDFYYLNRRLVRGRVHKKQVGKTKVDLFYKETEVLHKWIADQMWKIPEYRRWQYFWRLACYLQKRQLPEASRYAFSFASRLMSKKKYWFLYPFSISYFALVGKGRSVVRNIYRKVRVR